MFGGSLSEPSSADCVAVFLCCVALGLVVIRHSSKNEATGMGQDDAMATTSRRAPDEPPIRAGMRRPWARWIATVVAAVAMFAGCWWGLDAARVLDSGVAARGGHRALHNHFDLSRCLG